MGNELRLLWRYRELLGILVQRDLKVRYKNSLLGFWWSLLNPLAQVFVITLFLKFLNAGAQTKNYHAYVFCAMLPWLFFQTGLMDSSLSLIVHHGLIRRTSFPREIIPLASVGANLIHLAMATGVFLAWMVVVALGWWLQTGQLDWTLQPTVVLAVIPLAGLLLLVVGISLILSVWALYYEDVRFLLQQGLAVLYWAVPVLYFADLILFRVGSGERGRLLYTLYMLNPLAAFITAFRKLTLPPTVLTIAPPAGQPGEVIVYRVPGMSGEDWLFLGIALLVSAGVALFGYRYFSARKWKLAERA